MKFWFIIETEPNGKIGLTVKEQYCEGALIHSSNKCIYETMQEVQKQIKEMKLLVNADQVYFKTIDLRYEDY